MFFGVFTLKYPRPYNPYAPGIKLFWAVTYSSGADERKYSPEGDSEGNDYENRNRNQNLFYHKQNR